MFYTYESGGRVSRPISDYRSEVLSGSFAARDLNSFWFTQGPAIQLQDIGGTLAYYADRSIYNLVSQRSGLGVLSGAQSSQQQVPEGYVFHQAGPIYTWTTNELDGNADHNRILRPAPSRFLLFNNVDDSRVYSYHPAIIDLYTEVDYGLITGNIGATIDNGLVSDLNSTKSDYGRIWYVTNVESFGLRKVIGAAEAKATNAWVGEGRLVSFGRQTSPAVYGWITDGKVRSFTVHGTADVDFSPATSGRGILPLRGNSKIGIAAGILGTGTFRKFSGSANSLTVNPDERQMLFSFNGEGIEKNTETYSGSGSLKNFSNVVDQKVFAWNGSGTIHIEPDKSDLYQLRDIAHWVLDDIKGRPLSSIKYELSDEKHTEDYNESAIVHWTRRDYGTLSVCTTEETINGDVSGNATGCIVKVDTTARVVSGQTYRVAASQNAAQNSVDWGDVTFIASLQQDWGHILDTSDITPYGGIKIDPNVGAADKFLPSWTSRGYISKLSGEARVPLDVGVRGSGAFRFLGASKTNFSLLQPAEGLFRIISRSELAVGLGVYGSGNLFGLSGAAESTTFNPLERQMLFSFNGGYEKLTFTFGSYQGDGVLFNIAGGEERGTNSYVGSGEIKVRSNKPDQYTLEELAHYRLYEIKNINLADLRYEPSDEKHTENYNSSAFVPSVDLDYGLIIDPSLATCVPVDGNITSNTTGTSGCVKVVPGTTLSLDATYTVPLSTTIPSTQIDYGLISDIHSPVDDYGWILGTHAHGIPYGMFDITGNASTPRVRKYESEGGLFKITGKALLPLFASVFGTGLFKPQGASKTNFSLQTFGSGYIPGMYDEATYSFQVEHHGEGTLRKFGGSAESSTWNPLEKQMLFSFTGGYSHLKFTHGTWVGSGRIKNLATLEAEKSTYDYVGSGSIITWNKLEEARTYFYNCSSIVPFPDLDYGLLVDTSNLPVTTLTTTTITSDETAPTGVVRVGVNEVVSLGATYTVPSSTTIPTFSEDYGFVYNPADEPRDYEWILGTVAMGMPACIYGTIDVTGSADSIFQPNWVGRGGVTVLGASDTSRSRIVTGSGSIKTVSGSATTFSTAVESTGLFKIGDTSPYAFSVGVIGEGTLRKFSGFAESLTVNPEEKQLLFSFTGSAGDPGITLAHIGEGQLFTFDGSGFEIAKDYVGSGTIKLRTRIPRLDEPANEKHTEVYDLNVCWDPEEIDYGLLIDPASYVCVDVNGIISTSAVASSGCIKASGAIILKPGVTYTIPSYISTPTNVADYGYIYDPEDLVLDYGWILDDTGRECPFGPISVIRGSAGDPVRTFREVSSGESSHWSKHALVITGEAEIVVPPQWDSPAEPPVKVYGDAKPNFSLRTFGSGRLYSFDGGAESVTFVPAGGQVLFKFVPGPFSRWTTYDWQPSWVSKGGITIPTGEAKTHWVPHVIGSGTLRKFTGTSESFTVNPEERQLLFSFTGQHQVSFTANPPEDTARVVFTGDAWPTRYIPHWTGSGTIPITGIAKTHWVPHVIGSGTLRKFAGAAESFTVNPEERQLLFSFVGERISEKKTVSTVGFGTLQLSGESTQILTFAEQPFGRISVSGVGHTTRTRPYIGSGTLRKLGGSAESATFNPEEKQLLFSFTGERISEKRTVSTVGSGTLFGFSGASVTAAFAYETQGLYRISGESIIGFSLTHFGSGTLRKFGGSAESLTVNPDERQLLFSFTGEGSESLGVAETKQIEVDITGRAHPVLRTQAFHGSGTFSVYGDGFTRYVPNFIGSGTLRKFNGLAESLTVNPEEKQMLFSFTGEGSDRTTVKEISKGGTIAFSGTSGDPLLSFAEQPFVQTKISGKVSFTTHRSIYGTGSFRKFGGSAEAVAFNPEDRQVLFNFIGDATLTTTRSVVGTGTFRKLSGAAEAIAFNPDERQMLFSFNGEGADSRTAREIGTGTLSTTGEAGVLVRFAHTGEGTIPLSGDAHTTRARDFVGFGFVPTFSGAAVCTTFNPEERDLLFSFFGERISEKTTARELSKGGTLVVGSTSGDPLLTFAEQPFVKLEIEGEGYLTRAFGYQGSGRISNVNNVDQAFARAPYIGSGYVSITGNAFVQVQLFQPSFAQVWII